MGTQHLTQMDAKLTTTTTTTQYDHPLRTVETPMQSSIPLLPVRVAPARSAREGRLPPRALSCGREGGGGPRYCYRPGWLLRRRRRVQGGSARRPREGRFHSALGSSQLAHTSRRSHRAGQGLYSIKRPGGTGARTDAARATRMDSDRVRYGRGGPPGMVSKPRGEQRRRPPASTGCPILLFCDGSRRTAPSRPNPPAERRWGGGCCFSVEASNSVHQRRASRPGNVVPGDDGTACGRTATERRRFNGSVRCGDPGRPVQARWRAVRASCRIAGRTDGTDGIEAAVGRRLRGRYHVNVPAKATKARPESRFVRRHPIEGTRSQYTMTEWCRDNRAIERRLRGCLSTWTGFHTRHGTPCRRTPQTIDSRTSRLCQEVEL
jgi:hypothetical protein